MPRPSLPDVLQNVRAQTDRLQVLASCPDCAALAQALFQLVSAIEAELGEPERPEWAEAR
jgi:hypothetical protein